MANTAVDGGSDGALDGNLDANTTLDAADAEVGLDGALPDASSPDAATPDATTPDATTLDAAPPDAGASCLTQVAAGYSHTCAIRSGEVWCFGRNDEGELGDGSGTSRSRPVRVERSTGPITNAVEVSAGLYHTCLRTTAGEVFCQGSNDFDQLAQIAQARYLRPERVTEITGAKAIAVGGQTSCAIDGTDRVLCWGAGGAGQLGGAAVRDGPPTQVPNLTAAIDVAVGYDHACAIMAAPAGRAKCWGSNTAGQLGNGNTMPQTGPVDVQLDDIVELGAGAYHTCARQGDGEVYCWGWNGQGQLTGIGPSSGVPVKITLDGPASALAVGQGSVCARMASGSFYCWGHGRYGALGTGMNGNYDERTPLLNLAPGDQLGLGEFHSCVLRPDRLLCSGYDFDGQLGLGTLIVSHTFVDVVETGITDLTTGRAHTCVRKADGTPKCFGEGERGQLGALVVQSPQPLPTAWAGIASVDDLEAGNVHTCGILPDRSAVCTGYNDDGVLGTGEDPPLAHYQPVAVATLSGIAELAAGGYHTCARLTADGAIHCWGSNMRGQTGQPLATTKVLSPMPTGITGALGLAAGGEHTCIRTASEGVTCFGNNNSGQLGDNATSVSGPATVVKAGAIPLTGVLEVAAGDNTSCARTSSQVFCWGAGYVGQLGNNASSRSNIAVPVLNLTDAVELSGAGETYCARKSGGTVVCWGANTFGQLGNGSNATGYVPTTVLGLTDVAQLAVGPYHVCARKNDNSAVCWGRNEQGQLGTEPTLIRTSPVQSLLGCP